MHFLPPEDPITLYQTGFDDDLLGRIKTSKTLSEVLDKIKDPLVVALDGRWGTGKSYFLQRWVGAHRHQNDGKALTVYFDAFANDFQSDPLVSLISTLANRLPKEDQPKIQRLYSVAGKLIRPATRLGLAIASFGATEALNDLGDAAIDVIKSEADKALGEFWEREQGRQAAMDEFHSAIVALTETEDPEKHTPLVIVIDELDRCRPDYALDVLEVIKHFFAVPHVHFVLGVNLKALENSVKARYGAEIDATAYLQKFLSFTLELPDHVGNRHIRTPNILVYAEHVGEAMGIPRGLLHDINEQLEILSKVNNVSIRDVGKIMSSAALLPDEAADNHNLPGRRTVLVTLLIVKVIRPDFFPKLLSGSATTSELVKFFDAKDEYLTPALEDGSQNREYNYDVHDLFGAWSYICCDGVLKDPEETARISQQFSRFRLADNIKGIPLGIHENWLSTFKLT